jgi:hypothetical protein
MFYNIYRKYFGQTLKIPRLLSLTPKWFVTHSYWYDFKSVGQWEFAFTSVVRYSSTGFADKVGNTLLGRKREVSSGQGGEKREGKSRNY